MNQTLDAVGNANECTERNQLGYLTWCVLTDRVGASEQLPWVFLGRLQRKRYTLTVVVDLENLNGNFLTDFNNFAGVLDVLPRKLRNVNQTVYATKVDECTEVYDRRNNTGANLTLGQVCKEGAAVCRLALL